MSRINWALLAIFIAGFLLFLYGANIYNAVVGYAGIYMFVGSIIAYLAVYIYHELTKPQVPSPPAPNQKP
jgi:membrane-bound ClpP family serine protease